MVTGRGCRLGCRSPTLHHSLQRPETGRLARKRWLLGRCGLGRTKPFRDGAPSVEPSLADPVQQGEGFGASRAVPPRQTSFVCCCKHTGSNHSFLWLTSLILQTQRSIRIYNLIKQQLIKKLMSNSAWISSMAVHPGGDNLLVGCYDCKSLWFDLDLSVKPYLNLRLHSAAVRHVAFHPRYPLFATASDDCSLIVCHARVFK